MKNKQCIASCVAPKINPMKNQQATRLMQLLTNEELSQEQLLESVPAIVQESTSFLDAPNDDLSCYRNLLELQLSISMLDESAKDNLRFRLIRSVKTHINQSLDLIHNRIFSKSAAISQPTCGEYTWNISKIYLIELLYPLILSKAIVRTDGRPVGKECFCRYVADQFGIKLSNPSQMFGEIKARVGKSPTHFLESLIKILNEDMESSEIGLTVLKK